jgi:hypothetical protein
MSSKKLALVVTVILLLGILTGFVLGKDASNNIDIVTPAGVTDIEITTTNDNIDNSYVDNNTNVTNSEENKKGSGVPVPPALPN